MCSIGTKRHFRVRKSVSRGKILVNWAKTLVRKLRKIRYDMERLAIDMNQYELLN